jgi:hypothetical protein
MTKGRAVTFIGSCQIGWTESNRRSPSAPHKCGGLHQFKVLMLVLEIFARIGQY